MKKLLLLLTLAMGVSFASSAQKSSKMQMKNGVMMIDSKAMLYKAGKCTPLTTTFTCSDQCKISPDGTTMKLENGYQIDKDGKMTMIAHGQKDMCGPDCPMMKEKMKSKM